MQFPISPRPMPRGTWYPTVAAQHPPRRRRRPSPMEGCPRRAPRRLCVGLAFVLLLLLFALFVSAGNFARPPALLAPLGRAGAGVAGGEGAAGAACATQGMHLPWVGGGFPSQPGAVGAGGGQRAGCCLTPTRGLAFSEVGVGRLPGARSRLKPSPKNKGHV